MPDADFYLTVGDAYEPLSITPRQADGSIVQLPFATTAYIVVWDRSTKAVVVNTAASPNLVTFVPATDPDGVAYQKLHYDWQPNDIAVLVGGRFYYAVARAVYPDTNHSKQTFPNPTPLLIEVVAVPA